MQIVGLATNTKFLDDLASHREFVNGNVHTGFIDQYYDVSYILSSGEEMSVGTFNIPLRAYMFVSDYA